MELISSSVPNKVSMLLDCEPIESLIRNAGVERVKEYIERELIKLASMFNGNATLNLKDYQVPIIADQLIESYKWESIEDFTLCFRRGAAGYYDDKLLRLDGAVIGNWMRMYLEEKADMIEQRHAKQKHEEKKGTPNYVIDSNGIKHPIVDGTDYIKKILASLGAPEPEEQNNAKENAIQRKKVESPYRYFTVRNLQIMATSQEHAEKLVQLMIDKGDLEEID